MIKILFLVGALVALSFSIICLLDEDDKNPLYRMIVIIELIITCAVLSFLIFR